MRGPLDYEHITELEQSARTAAQHLDAAEQLRAWAVESHPDDQDVAPADFLVAAANHLRWAGDGDGALLALREAVAAEGDAPPDTRCYLHGELLEAGLREEADELAREVRRSRPDDSDVYVLIGEDYEAAGDLDSANRWLTMAMVRIEQGSIQARPWQRAMVRNGRYRIRRALGQPPDDLDAEAAAELGHHRLGDDPGEG